MTEDRLAEAALRELAGYRDLALLACRLADVEAHVREWLSGDETAGVLAADALDQLTGLLDDLPSVARDVAEAVEGLLKVLPPRPE